MSKIGENVYRLRVLQNKTQAELANEINVTSQAISKCERGIGYPDVSILPALCTALHTSIDTLMNYVPEFRAETMFEKMYASDIDSLYTTPSELAHYLIGIASPQEHRDIIDIGCGNGRDSVFFARNGYNVTAFDVAPSGIEHLYRFADYCHVPMKAFVADMKSWVPDEYYDVVYACRSLHYLKRDYRRDFIENYKKHTRIGGIHALEIFVKKPFVDAAPDQEPHVHLWDSGEVFAYYSDWELLKIEERIFDCCSSGLPHKHVCNIVVAKKVKN